MGYDAHAHGNPEIFLLGVVILLGIGVGLYALDRVVLS